MISWLKNQISSGQKWDRQSHIYLHGDHYKMYLVNPLSASTQQKKKKQVDE